MPPLPFPIPDTPPTWWGYLTPGIALLALIIASASYGNARATYRRAAPIVTISYFGPVPPMPDNMTGENRTGFGFSLTNTGLASVGVESFHLSFNYGLFVYSNVAKDSIRRRSGKKFPATLPGMNSLDWHYAIDYLGQLGGLGVIDPDAVYKLFRQRAKITVVLGNGRVLRKTYRNRGIVEQFERWSDRFIERLDAWNKKMQSGLTPLTLRARPNHRPNVPNSLGRGHLK